MKAKTGPLPN